MDKNNQNTNLQILIATILELAREAALAISKIYETKSYHIESKSDQSPVTEADYLAHEIIETGLKNIDPAIPIISEEGPEIPYEARKDWKRFWLVDPLDGTREFIKRTGDFSVNIALIEDHTPLLGVVLAPALNESYWAVKNQGAYYQTHEQLPILLKPRHRLHSPIKIAMSRSQKIGGSHHQEWEQFLAKIQNLDNYKLVYCGSALKICWVARGEVDFYPRFGPTYEWDTAAGQCILEEVGGKIVSLGGKPLKYNLRKTLVNQGFLAIHSDKLLSFLVDKSS